MPGVSFVPAMPTLTWTKCEGILFNRANSYRRSNASRKILMKVYKFLPYEYGILALRDRRLKVARINELNDPFEFLASDLGDIQVRRSIQSLKSRAAEWAAIISFSKSFSSPLLWSHYADSHRGVALEFNVPSGRLEHIEYSEKRLEPSREGHSPGTLDREFVLRAKRVKFKEWCYEDEARLPCSLEGAIPDSNGLFFSDFSPNLQLTGLLVGSMCDCSHQHVSEKVAELGWKFRPKQMRAAFKRFAMVEDQRFS